MIVQKILEKIYERQAHDPLWVIMAVEADTDGIVECIPERHLRSLLIELDEEFGKLTLEDLAAAYRNRMERIELEQNRDKILCSCGCAMLLNEKGTRAYCDNLGCNQVQEFDDVKKDN